MRLPIAQGTAHLRGARTRSALPRRCRARQSWPLASPSSWPWRRSGCPCADAAGTSLRPGLPMTRGSSTRSPTTPRSDVERPARLRPSPRSPHAAAIESDRAGESWRSRLRARSHRRRGETRPSGVDRAEGGWGTPSRTGRVRATEVRGGSTQVVCPAREPRIRGRQTWRTPPGTTPVRCRKALLEWVQRV